MYRDNGTRFITYLGLLAALGLAVPRPASAQTLDQAKDFFNSGKMEDACDAFRALDKAKPGDPQVTGFLNMSCREVKRLQKEEEDLFNQGVQLFNQGQFDDARQKFEQSSTRQGLKNFRYRDKALQYIKQIDARQSEEQAFQDAVRLYNSSKYAEAQTRFNSLAQGGGPHAADARSYLAKITATLQKQNADEQVRHAFDEGIGLYMAGDFANAYVDFEKVVKAGGPNAGKAREYIAKIEAKQKKEEAKVKPPQPPPLPQPKQEENPTPPPTPTRVSDQSLRAGLRAYFDGDLDAADRDLSDYLSQNGPKQALAYFFRGATRSSRFFLSGEKDSQEKELALADFQSAKTHDQSFQPPNQYVSPKILLLYSQASGAHTP